MSKHIVYKGASSKSDVSSEFHVRDAEGKMHRLREGYPVEVPDELASELLSGSDRTKGHKFEEADEKALREAGIEVDATATNTTDSATGGGSGGSGDPAGSAAGTATASARTGRGNA